MNALLNTLARLSLIVRPVSLHARICPHKANVRRRLIAEALRGNSRELNFAFIWRRTPQGVAYWHDAWSNGLSFEQRRILITSLEG